MPRGRQRMKTKPNNLALLKRCRRAQVGKPSLKKRKDIIQYITALCKFNKTHGTNVNAIVLRKKQLVEFDFRIGQQMIKAKLNTVGIKTIEEVIDLLRQDKLVRGFTLVRTCKADGNPTVIRALDLEDGMSLCVFAKQDRPDMSCNLKQNQPHKDK